MKNEKKSDEYIAHKRDNGDEQTLLEHLEGVAEIAACFAEEFDAADQGRLAGIAHDIGKYSAEFQRRIKEDGPKVDHSTAGAYLCAQLKQNYASICVAGHHSGLPDLGGRDDLTGGTLWARLSKAQKGEIPDYSAWKKELKNLPAAELPRFAESKGPDEAFYIRMLYSCLVDADFLDTEKFMSDHSICRNNHITIENLDQNLDRYINKWLPPTAGINEKRCAILENCMKKAQEDQGLFTFTVPTGGGKTVASMAFATKHARIHNLNRIIYVIPYTSIIEQTAEEFREIFGEDAVLEHHSGVEYDSDETEMEKDIRMSLATENWDMPVIVTTAVQFFESLFSNKGSKCRKLHNISKSVVVFDEAQMLPIPFLRPCVYAITEFVKRYHVSAVLCTATQPSLDPVIKIFYKEYVRRELCPLELSTDSIFTRNRIVDKGTVTWDDVVLCIEQHPQILCVVNTRKNARQVYERLVGEGTFHLSTLMIPKERKRVLKEIRERLRAGKICRVVSTSLIEAGVDVDFPVVMREMAGLDSILQAAGRCNREGRKNLSESVVIVFRTEDPVPPVFKTNISASRYAIEAYDDLFSEECIKCYFDNLYNLKGVEEQDKNHILELLNSDKLCFKEAALRFCMIENNTYTIYIPLEEGRELIERRRNGEISKALIRKLGQFGISVFEKHLSELNMAGDVEQIGKNEWVLVNELLYDRSTGLSLDADNGKAIFI